MIKSKIACEIIYTKIIKRILPDELGSMDLKVEESPVLCSVIVKYL